MGLSDDLLAETAPQARREALGRIADLLDRNGIDPAEIGTVHRISLYQSLTKNNEGDAEIHDLVGIQLSPAWAEGPEWPVVQQAAPTKITPAKLRPLERVEKVTVILPDPQIGFWRLSTGEMVPIHDEAAMAAAMQVLVAARPDVIVNLGDLVDFPEWSSKFLVKPEFVLTTQPTLDRAHRFLAEQRAVAPQANMLLLAGNHDVRLGHAITRNAMAALRLRRANVPDEWPVMSLPFLLRLDELGVKYIGGYPAGRVQLTEGGGGMTGLWAVHGEKLDVAKVAKTERQSFVQGHIHRAAMHQETYEIGGRAETVMAFSPGCLCRVDGAVPSSRGGEDEHGRPMVRWENWQQGVAVVTEFPDGSWDAEIVPIRDGVASWRGSRYGSPEVIAD